MRHVIGDQPAKTGERRNGFRYSPAILPGLMRAADLVIVAAVAVIAYQVLGIERYYFAENYVFATIFVLVCYYLFSLRTKIHHPISLMRPVSGSDDIIILIFTSVMLLLSVVFALKVSGEFSLSWITAFSGGSIVALLTMRILVGRLLRAMWRRRLIGRTMAVLGVGEQSRRFLLRVAATRPYFIALGGVFRYRDTDPAESVEGFPVLGNLDDLFAWVRDGRIDDIVIALPWNADQAVTETVERLKELPVNVYLSTDLIGFELAFHPVTGSFAALPMFEVVQRPISGWSSALKAIEDYVLASVALLLVSPLLLIIAIAIKLDSPGPVFFMQKRLGFNNEVFSIYKFRSMRHREAPETDVRQATRADPRVTRVGRIIRATSLDELPQLLNVLNGAMSLVGPRPHAINHNEEYGRRIRGYFARHRVKPGITGWAQVNGLRGETDTIEKMEARIRHDVYYAENWSLLFDLKILTMTVLIVPFQKSAY